MIFEVARWDRPCRGCGQLIQRGQAVYRRTANNSYHIECWDRMSVDERLRAKYGNMLLDA